MSIKKWLLFDTAKFEEVSYAAIKRNIKKKNKKNKTGLEERWESGKKGENQKELKGGRKKEVRKEKRERGGEGLTEEKGKGRRMGGGRAGTCPEV